ARVLRRRLKPRWGPRQAAAVSELFGVYMGPAPYFPYRSEAARQVCFAYLDSLAAREWPIASEQRFVPTTDGETFVRISGPEGAPPLVLLHGATATSLMWAPNIAALSAEYRTFAVDQIGEFGRS